MSSLPTGPKLDFAYFPRDASRGIPSAFVGMADVLNIVGSEFEPMPGAQLYMCYNIHVTLIYFVVVSQTDTPRGVDDR